MEQTANKKQEDMKAKNEKTAQRNDRTEICGRHNEKLTLEVSLAE